MKKYIIILITFVFTSCASYKDSIKLPGYEEQINDTRIAIVYLPELPVVANVSDVEDDLGEGNPEEVYFNFFKNSFPEQFKAYSSCSEVHFIDSLDKFETAQRTIKLPNDSTITLLLPNEGITFRNLQCNPDYILFIENLSVYTQRRTWLEFLLARDKFRGNIAYGDDNDESLKHRGKYAYWDNRTGKLAACGTFYTKTFFHFIAGLRKNVWDASLHHIARQLTRNSPFRNEKANYRVDYTQY